MLLSILNKKSALASKSVSVSKNKYRAHKFIRLAKYLMRQCACIQYHLSLMFCQIYFAVILEILSNSQCILETIHEGDAQLIQTKCLDYRLTKYPRETIQITQDCGNTSVTRASPVCLLNEFKPLNENTKCTNPCDNEVRQEIRPYWITGFMREKKTDLII